MKPITPTLPTPTVTAGLASISQLVADPAAASRIRSAVEAAAATADPDGGRWLLVDLTDGSVAQADDNTVASAPSLRAAIPLRAAA